jgi:hypothetical protein
MHAPVVEGALHAIHLEHSCRLDAHGTNKLQANVSAPSTWLIPHTNIARTSLLLDQNVKKKNVYLTWIIRIAATDSLCYAVLLTCQDVGFNTCVTNAVFVSEILLTM